MKNLLIIFTTILIINQIILEANDSTLIENELVYLERLFSVKDSSEYVMIKDSLIKFIKKIEGNQRLMKFTNYYTWCGEGYSFAYKAGLGLDSSWDKCVYYHKKALENSSDPIRSKIGLTGFYGSSWNPGNPETNKYLLEGSNLLQQMIKDGHGEKYSSIYWNLGFYALRMQNPFYLFEAISKYKKYFPKDENYKTLEGMLRGKNLKCIDPKHQEGLIIIINSCIGFKFSYSNELILHGYNDKKDTSFVIMLETPFARMANGQSIRNSITLSVSLVTMFDNFNPWDKFNKNDRFVVIKDKEKKNRKFITTKSFKTNERAGEEYQGIYKLFGNKTYWVELIFMATENTILKNEHFYKFITESFQFDKN